MHLLLAPLLALAAPDALSWDLSIGDQVVGQRTLTVQTESIGGAELRTLRAETRVDASVLGRSFAFRQKLTANADHGPASFVSATDLQGELMQVQGRRAALGWILTVTADDRTRTWELDATDVDLSTADLLDPGSRVPLSRFTEVALLSAETGDILRGTVEPLGPSEVRIGETEVAVEGYRLRTDDGDGVFFYTSEGWLVRFETRLFGRAVAGTLSAPPPRGADDQPVPVFGPPLESEPL